MEVINALYILVVVGGIGVVADPTISCPVPVSPRNGQVILQGNGQWVIYACDPGYYLIGPRTSRCVDKAWTGEPPLCRALSEIPSCRTLRCSQKCVWRKNQLPVCECRKGFELLADSRTCREEGPCSNFGCSHTCLMLSTGPQCFCPIGYQIGVDGKTCTDFDECSNRRINRCEYECKNTVGGFMCACPDGYTLVDQVKCQDIDECAKNNFNCSYRCENTPGNAFCTCPDGYRIGLDTKTCVDIDECAIGNGACEHHCHNFDGGFECSCSDGYRLSGFHSCTDIDECAIENGACQHYCHNFDGGFKCSCTDGYELSGFQSCIAVIECPRIPTPAKSKMMCNNGAVQLEERDSYPEGTKCRFKCIRGFKRNSGGATICGPDGQWSGTPSECIARQCSPLIVPEHGDIHPAECKEPLVGVHRRCYFTCEEGYQLDGPRNSFMCSRNFAWLPSNRFPKCVPVDVYPYIVCPQDITVPLPRGRNSVEVVVTTPQSNVMELSWHPPEMSPNVPMAFPAGITNIQFNATGSGRTASCTTVVHIIDIEPPEVVVCPKSFEVQAGDGSPVTYQEPIFRDNVRVASVHSNVEPGSLLAPGTHWVKYSAFDEAGNVGECDFTIKVEVNSCDMPEGPANGNANCEDSFVGRVCHPVCEKGFVLYPQEPFFFSCDDTGVWYPSDVIQDCVPFVGSENSTCPEGLEYQQHIETGEEICVYCPQGYYWSYDSQMCTPDDDEDGQNEGEDDQNGDEDDQNEDEDNQNEDEEEDEK